MRGDLARHAVADASYRGPVYPAAARQLPALACLHVAGLAADVGLVHCHGAVQHHLGVVTECFAQPVEQMPRRCLPHPEVAVQFHAPDAHDVRRHRVDGDSPSPQAELGAVHNCADLHTEARAALATGIGLVTGTRSSVQLLWVLVGCDCGLSGSVVGSVGGGGLSAE